ncbi:hypothetical protein Pan265_17380 [Mucisphaera calidilacus]|uniref:Uncharacterized protein n=1 Tax=Mucisphaera calidilacus TaxID=2527982 RepID=A0A518BY32_9BACT|nr:hypothetical protein Pan265_17380 [Mucisphaera calidilacus]
MYLQMILSLWISLPPIALQVPAAGISRLYADKVCSSGFATATIHRQKYGTDTFPDPFLFV